MKDSDGNQEVIVTARRLRDSAINTVEPVATLDQAAIRSLGVTSMGELMQRLKPMTTSASGSEPVYLLNGRRISGFGEVQSLPFEAVERTEILPEQEAPRFGFPPTVKLVNIITKKRFRSLVLREAAGTTTDGGGGINYAEATSTRIAGPRRTLLSISHMHQNALLQSDRDIVPDPDALFALGGNVTAVDGGSLDPRLDALTGNRITVAAVPADAAARQSLTGYLAGANAPAVSDLGRYRSLQQRTDTVKLDGTYATPLTQSVDGSLNLTLEGQRSAGLNGLAPAVLTVPGASTALPFSSDVLLYRYLPDVVLRQHSSALNLHAGGTVQGGLRRWLWNITSSYDRVTAKAYSDQSVPLAMLQAAVDTGGDPLQPVDPRDAMQRLRNRSNVVTRTAVNKATANGPLMRLPAGDALVTLTADYARSSSTGNQPGLGDAAPNLARTTTAASISADLPITTAGQGGLSFMGRLAVNGMIGVSDVSRYGRLVNSNYGVNWTPIRPAQFSASISETQTPPAIALLTSPILTSPNTPFFDFTTGTSAPVTAISGGNPNLAPERRRVTTVGVALQPIRDKEVRLNLDYLDTRIINQTAYLGSVTSAFQSAFPDLFMRDARGQLIQVDLRPVNIASERERKVRMILNFWTPLGSAPPPPAAPPGTPSPETPPPPPPKPRPMLYGFVSTTWRLDDRLELRDGQAPLDLLDGATLTGTGGRPRWEVEGNLGGTLGALSAGVYGQLQGATRIRSDLPASDLSFSGRFNLVLYGTLDVEKLSREKWARKFQVQLTVENLLNDRINVRDRTGATPNRFQEAYLDPLGRSVRVSLRKLF